MSVEATASKYKKNTHWIIIAALIFGAGYCIYDGFYNEKFIEKHTEDGVMDSTLIGNRKLPPYLAVGAVVVGINLARVWKKKVVAGETSLDVCGTEIAYDSMESINKTHFESKGFFTIAYKDSQGSDNEIKISDKDYDGLGILLDEVVAKIS